MNNSQKCGWFRRWGIPLLAFLLGAVLSAGAVLAVVSRRPGTKLRELEQLIDDKFIAESDEKALEDAAASAMVKALGDRWSHYMSAEDMISNRNTMNSQYVGVGISISLREDGQGYDITKVEENGPAAAAGVQVGDILLGADDKTVADDGGDAVTAAVRGEKGTDVTLHLQRDGAPLSLAVTRDTVAVQVASGTMLDGQIGYVRINAFHRNCAKETVAVIDDLLNQGAAALIFDVRNNPGGYTDELVTVLDKLLPEGPVFRTESYDGATHTDYSDADCVSVPMAVLVNGDSYSAAEFFAAALQEYGVAAVVGEKTCGKGYYQCTYGFSDGSGVALSVGKYFTPNGVSLIGLGVAPDEEIAVDEDTAAAIAAGTLPLAEDPQILAAVQAVKSGK